MIRPKLTGIDPELVDELLTIMGDIKRWIERGENDEVRAMAAELAERIKVSDGPRATCLQLAHMAAIMVPFEIDDPEFEDEEFAFRAWRTVERGFTEMDRRHALDPMLRVFPRKAYSIQEQDDEVVVTGFMETDPKAPDEPGP